MDSFARQLQSHGMKATAQRMAVHRVMMERIHASADTVYESIRGAGEVKISKTSIYNILNDLADKGIYRRRLSSGSKMFFDINTHRHVHLYDTRNHEFLDVEADAVLKAVESGLRRRRFRGYSMDDIDIQILCHPTRRKKI